MWFLYSKIPVLPVWVLWLFIWLFKKRRRISRKKTEWKLGQAPPPPDSELTKEIFEMAKGLLMNRLFIDLWTKQSLIMCRAAFNWGRRTSPLLAERLRGREWRAFDRALRHRGEGWGAITQPGHCAVFPPTCSGLYFFRPLRSPSPCLCLPGRPTILKKIPQNGNGKKKVVFSFFVMGFVS